MADTELQPREEEVKKEEEDAPTVTVTEGSTGGEATNRPSQEEPSVLPPPPAVAPSLSSPDPTPLVAPPLHIYHESWSSLPRDVLVDKVKGLIYGQAIGDALGLATEFMNKQQALGVYGPDGPDKYSEIIQDFHRSRWDQGDWTDDTDQLLLILQVIVEGQGKVQGQAFARKMHNWRISGFKELGDVGGMGIGMTVSRTLTHRCFLEDPHTAAREVWEQSGRYLAANGAIMRTSILGVLEFNNVNRVVANTREICLTTHADPRCLASCIAVTTALALILQGVHDPNTKKGAAAITEAALKEGSAVLEKKDQRKELAKHMKCSSLDALKLDDKNTIGYTFKALGAGFYGLQHSSDFRTTIKKVIVEAGDADSNAAVCGALMGAKFGFSCLPQDLLAFKHREWLDRQVASFLTTIGLPEQAE